MAEDLTEGFAPYDPPACEVVYAFKIFPKEWESTIITVEEQTKYMTDIFHNKSIYISQLNLN